MVLTLKTSHWALASLTLIIDRRLHRTWRALGVEDDNVRIPGTKSFRAYSAIHKSL